MGARGGGQEATTISFLGVIATTKLWLATSRWPHLPGSLSSLTLLNNPKSRATCPEKAHHLPQIGKLPQSWPQQALLSTPTVSAIPLFPAQLNKWALISCYFRPLVSGKGTDTWGWPTNRHAAAKSLQSCPTLCDPIDGSPPGPPRPWDSPGKNTGVGCYFLLQCILTGAHCVERSIEKSQGHSSY